MYFSDSAPAVFGFGQPPTESHVQAPRCRTNVFRIPGSYGEFENAVKAWISTCVTSSELSQGRPMHREIQLVTNNPSLASIWNNILRHRVGQNIEIRAEYVWGQFKVESIRFSTPAQPPAPPPPPPVVVRPPQPPIVLPNRPDPPPGPIMKAGEPDPTPYEDRQCFEVSCGVMDYLKENWGITPSQATVRNALKKEQFFLRRTKYRNQYRAILPQALIFQPIDSWGEEMQKATMELNQQVEREARERVFTLLFRSDPTFRLGGGTVGDLVNSRFAR